MHLGVCELIVAEIVFNHRVSLDDYVIRAGMLVFRRSHKSVIKEEPVKHPGPVQEVPDRVPGPLPAVRGVPDPSRVLPD